MKKANSVFQTLLENFKNLVPYIGALLVAAGIIGLLFIQKPLETSQDTRSEAKTADTVAKPGISAELRTKFEVNKTGEVAFNLNSANYTFTHVYAVFNITNKDLDTPEVIVNQGSGFDAKEIEVQKISDGYLVKVTAVKNNLDWLVEPSDKSLIRLKLVPRKPGKLQITFDPDRTYAETLNLAVQLTVPTGLEYEITGSTGSDTQTACKNSGGTWKEFPNSCADNCWSLVSEQACLDVLTDSCDCGATKCWNGTTCANNPGTTPPPSGTPTPTPTITPSPTPTPTVPPVQGCNETCTSNRDCEVGMRCYATGGQKLCRLAINPSSSSCQESSGNTGGGNNGGGSSDTGSGTTQITLRSCNQYCTSNSECVAGLTCYESFCRNPQNPQDYRCANPTVQQTAAVIQSCNETCSTNRDCAVNLRCYEGQCRLATNVSSTSCSATTQETVSNAYSNKVTDASNAAEVADSDTPLKGEKTVENATEFNEQDNALIEKKIYDDSYEADETLWGLVKNLIKNPESKLPFFIILVGILLLVLSILFAVMSRLRKPGSSVTYHPHTEDRKIDVQTYAVKPGTPQGSEKAKELLKTLENQPKA